MKKITLISLQTNENLRELHLNHNTIGDRTVVLLSSALSINSFTNCQARGIFSKKSDLCHGALATETFVKYQYVLILFNVEGNEALKVLNLGWNVINRKGAKFLSATLAVSETSL